MIHTRRCEAVFFPLAVLLCAITSQAADQPNAKQAGNIEIAKPASKPLAPFTISKETTYIVEPLDKDGYPDYCSALNQRLGKGVTQENNAAVPFWRAVGPHELPTECREKYFKLLGMELLPEKGDYLLTERRFAMQVMTTEHPNDIAATSALQEVLFNDQTQAAKRPWSRKGFPRLAAWLDTNKKPLDAIVAAAERPKWFSPIVPDKGDSQIAVSIAVLQPLRMATRLLACRALLSFSEGRMEDARQDLRACHRLAFHAAHGPYAIDVLVATSLDLIALSAERGIAQPTLSVRDALLLDGDVTKLPLLPRVAETLDFGERCFALDLICKIARKKTVKGSGLLFPMDPDNVNLAASIDKAIQTDLIDWNIVLRAINAQMDRVVNSARKPKTYRSKSTILGPMDAETAKKVRLFADLTSPAGHVTPERRKQASDALADILNELCVDSLLAMSNNADPRRATERNLTKLSFLLAAYHADHSEFPVKLSDLSPKYIVSIPKDSLSGEDFHYKKEGGGYLLYSIGFNGRDDGGKGLEDCKEGDTWDDIAVRVPAKK